MTVNFARPIVCVQLIDTTKNVIRFVKLNSVQAMLALVIIDRNKISCYRFISLYDILS